MSADNSKKSTNNGKKQSGKFRSKHVKHNPQQESAGAKSGMYDGQRDT